MILLLRNDLRNVAAQAMQPDLAVSHLAQRDKLTIKALMTARPMVSGPVHNDYFLPVGEATGPQHTFSGVISVPEAVMRDVPVSGDRAIFPGFAVPFFTFEDYLVPAVRDIVAGSGGQSGWRIILSPGKLWSEPGDGDFSRASFPFVLTTAHSNEAHNGIATFVFNEMMMSALRFQVVQETAVAQQYDLWGQIPATYVPGPVESEALLAAQFATEIESQLPILPWSALNGRVDTTTFNGGLAPEAISAAGLVLDGTLYLQPCMTRYGPFPYCRHMRHGAYSLTKTMGAMLAMLWLAEKYGDAVFDLKIEDYVAVTAVHDGWQDVTFGDALNMATGIGDYPNQQNRLAAMFFPADNVFVEEDSPKMTAWMAQSAAADKLVAAFAFGNYPWGPGERMRYNTSQTFVLAAAMQNYLRQQEGPDARLWPMVIEEVLQPLGLYHLPMLHTQETDDRETVPIMGIGLYVTVEDVAKIAILLQSEGRYRGQQLLHAERLKQALFRSDKRGVPIGRRNQFGDESYQLSLWSFPYRTDDGRFFQIPYMSGYGGNFVVLLPNGVTTFRLADSENYDVRPLLEAGAALRPLPGQGIPVTRQLIWPEKLYLSSETETVANVIDKLLVGLLVITAVMLVRNKKQPKEVC